MIMSADDGRGPLGGEARVGSFDFDYADCAQWLNLQ